MYTLNQEEIPTPYSGNFLYDKSARIILSKEALGVNCKVVELKVIAVAKDQMPSVIAYKRYDMKEGLRTKPPL